MRVCKDHWAKMREKIEELGMTHLVARTGEEAHAAMVEQIKGEYDPKKSFDPLMSANWAITGQFLEDVGLSAFDGDKCPLCEVEKSKPGLAQNWIDGCLAGQLDYARHLGLMPQEQ